MKRRLVAAFAAVLFSVAAGSFAGAQSTAPTPAPTTVPSVPPNLGQDAVNALGNLVKSAFGWSDNESYGMVTFYRGYTMEMRMQLNRYREIRLHRGTVIEPRGWTIRPGETVDVRGTANSDGSLNANTIVVQNPH
jgi:hypothetical protein